MKIEHELLHRIISINHLCVIPNFYLGAFECDLFALNKNLWTTEYEIKCSKSDFNNDFKNKTSFAYKNIVKNINNKHEQIKQGKRTNRFYFVVDENIDVEIPDYAGLIKFRKYINAIEFDYIKMAPLLHRDKVCQGFINHCLERLSWKHYYITRKI